MRTLRTSTAAVLAMVTVLVSGCNGTTGGIAATSSGPPAVNAIDAALALVPASSGSAEVMDLAAAKQRWGLTGVTSETEDSAEADEFLRKLGTSGSGSRLLQYTRQLQGAGWSGLDVDQQIDLTADGMPVSLYRLRSSLDMQKVIDSLSADGMTRSGSADAPFFQPASLGRGKFGGVFLYGVTVYPAQHLIVGGREAVWTPPTAGGSLGAVEGVPALLAGLPAADWVAVDTGAAACTDPLAGLILRATPEIARRYLATLDAAGERQRVTGVVVALTADDTAQIRTGYADEATAAADLPVRTKILQTGSSAKDNRPYTDVYTAQIAADEATLHYDIHAERAATLIQRRFERDTPWAFC
ncbi:MAG: hypothetical protein WKF57_21360 [Nakamurella sp.]